MKIFYYSEQYQTLLIETEQYRYSYLFVPPMWKKKIARLIKKGNEGEAWQTLKQFELESREELQHREKAGQTCFAFLKEV